MSGRQSQISASRISAAEFAALMRDGVPYVGQLDIEVVELAAGRIVLRMPVSDLLVRPGGTVTGPALMALADIAVYGVVLSLIGRVELAVTTNLSINFLRRPAMVPVLAEARCLKLGQRLAVGDVLLYSEGGAEPIAHATCTYSIPPENQRA